MDGFKLAGRAFCVVEDLRQFAEAHKGKTVAEALKEKRRERLEQVEAQQFGMTVEAFRGCVK